MKINTNWNLGNFSVDLAVDADAKLMERFAALGVLHAGQRVSAIDKTLGAFNTVNGKAERKAGWKRNDVEFSPTMAQRLAALFEKLALPAQEGEEKDLEVPAVVTVTEYVKKTAVPAFKEEKEILSARESAGTLEAFLAKTSVDLPGIGKVALPGYTGPTHTEDGEAFHPDALANCKAKYAAMKAAQAAALAKALG